MSGDNHIQSLYVMELEKRQVFFIFCFCLLSTFFLTHYNHPHFLNHPHIHFTGHIAYRPMNAVKRDCRKSNSRKPETLSPDRTLLKRQDVEYRATFSPRGKLRTEANPLDTSLRTQRETLSVRLRQQTDGNFIRTQSVSAVTGFLNRNSTNVFVYNLTDHVNSSDFITSK
jgi:hypothetical protein